MKGKNVMKKIISLIMVVAMACLAFVACTPANTDQTSGNAQSTVATLDPNLPAEEGFGLAGETPTDVSVFKYKELKDGTVAITGTYADAADLTKIVVPALINGKKVSTIDASGLATLKKATEIVVSGYVTKIGEYAFRDCEALATLKLPQYITEIGEGAFSGCKALTSTDFLPTSLMTLGARAFENCGLQKVTLPDSIETIGGYTFVGCSYLKEIKLPASLKAIPEKMFMGCSQLSKTTGSEDKFVIPAGVKSIGDMAFYECNGIKYVELPEGLEKIGKQVFDTCRRLADVTVPSTVKSIGDKAFTGCNALKTVTFLTGADTKIGKSIFEGAKKVEAITVKAGSSAETYCNEWKTASAELKGYAVFTITVQ
jgi:hypothetical protein